MTTSRRCWLPQLLVCRARHVGRGGGYARKSARAAREHDDFRAGALAAAIVYVPRPPCRSRRRELRLGPFVVASGRVPASHVPCLARDVSAIATSHRIVRGGHVPCLARAMAASDGRGGGNCAVVLTRRFRPCPREPRPVPGTRRVRNRHVARACPRGPCPVPGTSHGRFRRQVARPENARPY
jgi:hypothetical protein